MSPPDMFLEGTFIMYPILLCLIVIVYFTVERFFVLRKAHVDVRQFMIKVRSIFRKGDIDPVLAFCSLKGVPLANIIRRGALKHDLGGDRVREVIEDAAKEETYHLERRLPILESIARIAPMLGLLGTLTGVANALQGIASVGPGHVAQVVSTALTALILGLAVGILSLAACSYLKARVAKIAHEMSVAKTEFLDLLRETAVEKPLPVQSESLLSSYSLKPAATLVFEDDLYFRKKK